MRGIGLFLVLFLGSITAAVFAFEPLLDMQIAAYFQQPDVKDILHWLNPYLAAIRDYSTALTVFFTLLPVCSILVKLIWPQGPMLVPARAAFLIIATFALAPGLLANGILKSHWHRPRPAAIVEFGGTQSFTPWWDPRGGCSRNCSFVSGEATAAFALLAPAVVVPSPWRYPAIGAVVAYGTGISLVRVAFGRHFLTDVIFSALFAALIVWLLHGFIYRWKWTRLTEASAERLIEKAGLALRPKRPSSQTG